MTSNEKLLELVGAGWANITAGAFAFTDRKAQQQLIELARSAPPSSSAFRAAGPDGSDLAVLGARLTTQTADTLDGRTSRARHRLTIGIGGGAPLIAINRLAAWFGLTPAESAPRRRIVRRPDAGGLRRTPQCQHERRSLPAEGHLPQDQCGSQAQLISQIRNLPCTKALVAKGT